MAAMFAETPFRPPGYDFAPDLGSSSLDSTSSPSLDLESLEEFERSMTQITQYGDDSNQLLWSAQNAQSPSETSRSDAPSPGKLDGHAGSHLHHHHHAASLASGGSYSLSPADASMILTPTSTNYDDHDPDSDIVSTSPASGLDSPIDGFVHVDSFDIPSSAPHRRMNVSRPAPVSGVYSSATPAPSRSSHQTSILQQTSTQQWPMQSFTSSSDTSMDDQFDPYNTSPGDLDFTGGSFNNDDLSAAQLFGDPFAGQTFGNIPFRMQHDGSMGPSSTFGTQNVPQQPAARFRQDMHATGAMNARPAQPFGTYNASQYQGSLALQSFQGYPPPTGHPLPPQSTLPSNAARARPQQQPSNAPTQSIRQARASIPAPTYHQNIPQAHHGPRVPSVPSEWQISSNRSPPAPYEDVSYQALQEARASQPKRSIKSESSQSATQRGQTSPSDRVRKGGRTKDSHLSETSRAKISTMRKVGACWRCAMQRDPCDDGSPCTRCRMRSQRGQAYYFDCDRSKLPDFVHDFLPPSMTMWHQKQSIEDTVSAQVLAWDIDNGIDVYLSSGYGPPLRWKLHEFTPRSTELLRQIQFKVDDKGAMVSSFKYAPPFGLMKIETSDDAHFEAYLDQLMEPRVLMEFAWKCYEEEEALDEGIFQVKLLELMCKLYINTTDMALKLLLRDILRMMIINYIMARTLTIAEDTLHTVLSYVRHSHRPESVPRHTSPRLANRQLKFFFAVLRNNIYEKLLKWQQATLHSAGKKDQTWLQTFCVMLGFAMVLEDVQRTIQLQAETAIQRGEQTHEHAFQQAGNACERIDARFKLLVGLFQCKYRDRKWGSKGSFGPGTPELREPVQREFCERLRALVVERYDHLHLRSEVQFREDQFHLWITRLTARFLLPFLNLPVT